MAGFLQSGTDLRWIPADAFKTYPREYDAHLHATGVSPVSMGISVCRARLLVVIPGTVIVPVKG